MRSRMPCVSDLSDPETLEHRENRRKSMIISQQEAEIDRREHERLAPVDVYEVEAAENRHIWEEEVRECEIERRAMEGGLNW